MSSGLFKILSTKYSFTNHIFDICGFGIKLVAIKPNQPNPSLSLSFSPLSLSTYICICIYVCVCVCVWLFCLMAYLPSWVI